jgi:hypothetical protein
VAVKSVENSKFFMILYERENERDFQQFKYDCERIISGSIMRKDLVLDFTGCGFTLPGELCLIGELLKKMLTSGRQLKLIVTPHLSKKLSVVRLDKVPGMTLFPSRSAFLGRYIRSKSSSTQLGPV